MEDWQVLDLLSSLVDKSLVVYEEDEKGGGRFRLTESVREYGRDLMRDTGERKGFRDRHRDYFLAFAGEADRHLTGPEQGGWLLRLESDHDNLRAALDWCLTDPESRETGLLLAGTLRRFWLIHGHLSEAREYLEALLTQQEGAEKKVSPGRATALMAAGRFATEQGALSDARAFYGEGIRLYEALNDPGGKAVVLCALGHVVLTQGDLAQARALLEESLAIQKRVGGRRDLAWPLSGLGLVALGAGDYGGARRHLEESRALYREAGDRTNLAIIVGCLGYVRWCEGDLPAARARYEESLRIQRALDDQRGIGWSLFHLADVARVRGDQPAARTLFEESLRIRRALGHRSGVAWSLMGLANVALGQGDIAGAGPLYRESLTTFRDVQDAAGIAFSLERTAAHAAAEGDALRAARLFGAAEAFRQTVGYRLPPVDRAGYYDAAVAGLRASLGDGAFAAEWAAGRALTRDEAIAAALLGGGSSDAAS